MTRPLQGQHVLVVGASSGMGRGVALHAASAAMFLMTNPFITGTTIMLDGGGTLV